MLPCSCTDSFFWQCHGQLPHYPMVSLIDNADVFISISCQRCRKKLCMFYLPQILKLFYCKEESYWFPFLCPRNNSCMVFSWSIVSCVRMWQVVLGYIVPVAEVTTHIWTYTNIFQITKEVALTWLDMALTNIGWLNTGLCISSNIVYAQNPCRVLLQTL